MQIYLKQIIWFSAIVLQHWRFYLFILCSHVWTLSLLINQQMKLTGSSVLEQREGKRVLLDFTCEYVVNVYFLSYDLIIKSKLN